MKPTLSELEKFEDQPEGIDLEVVTESTGTESPQALGQAHGRPWAVSPSVSHICFAGKEREHNFQPGDNVEVCEGELINLQGKILSVDGNKITIMPKHEDLKVCVGGVQRGPHMANGACVPVRGMWACLAMLLMVLRVCGTTVCM